MSNGIEGGRAHTAATEEFLYADFRPGQRVLSIEGFPGVVTEVLEGPGNNTIVVRLDNGMGGGQYSESDLSPLNTTSASGQSTAADSYPELGSILTDRPDHLPSISEDEYLGRRSASILAATTFAVSAAMVHCTECDVDYAIDSAGEAHQHTAMARIPALPDYLFEGQVGQYPLIGVNGISYFKGVIDFSTHVDCLLFRKDHKVVGILNHYPQDFPDVGQPKGSVLILVDPGHRNEGIGTALLKSAIERWDVDPQAQDHTPMGQALVDSLGSLRLAEWDLHLPLEQGQPAADEQKSAQPGYSDGFSQAKANETREPASDEPSYRANFAQGWADGIMARPPQVEIPKTDPSDLGTSQDGSSRLGELQITAGFMDFLKGNDTPSENWAGPGHNWSFDWCRFRKNSRCMYPKELNKAATELAGYVVWVPEDRGYCPRIEWDDQKTCPVGEPGPNVPDGFIDATVPWEQGGQRDGIPGPGYRPTAARANLSGDSFGFVFTATWNDVRAKAKAIRSSGGVRVLSFIKDVMACQVRGENHVYQTEVHTVPDRYAVSHWVCGCAWGAYSWGRTGPWKKYEGRMCSHALATVYEAQSRGMFGKTITEDQAAPAWAPRGTEVKVDGDWNRDKGRYAALKEDGAWDLVSLMLNTGASVLEVHTSLLEMGLSQHLASRGPLRGKINGRVKNLTFVDGVVLDAGRPVSGTVLYPNYDPSAGLNFRALHQGSVGNQSTDTSFRDNFAGRVLAQSSDSDNIASIHGARRQETQRGDGSCLRGDVDSGAWGDSLWVGHSPSMRSASLHPTDTPKADDQTGSRSPARSPEGDKNSLSSQSRMDTGEHSGRPSAGHPVLPEVRSDHHQASQAEEKDARAGLNFTAHKIAEGKQMSSEEWGLWSEGAVESENIVIAANGEDHWGIGAAADLHEEPEAALPVTDGGGDDEHRVKATAAVMAALAAVATPAQSVEPKVAEAKDPHAWLMNGNGSSGDVAAMAQQFLATKTGTKNFSAGERAQIIGEGEGTLAGNLSSLDLSGTHYQALDAMPSVTDDEIGFF